MKKIILLLLFLFPVCSIANTVNKPRIVIAPKCLIDKANVSHRVLVVDNDLLLVQVSDDQIEQIAAVKSQKPRCGGFMDVTDEWAQIGKRSGAKAFLSQYSSVSVPAPAAQSYSIKYPAQVNQLLAQTNPQRLWDNLTKFTSFPDRSATSDTGVQAAEWLRDQVKTMANGRTDVEVYLVPTAGYKQPSVVAKLGTSSEPGIVVGGHMDTLTNGKPGADDDGTGSMTVLEVAQTIISSGMQFKKPIYFIWYAAEERGLVGSKNVVNKFKKDHIPVANVIHLDMTGYPDKKYPTAIWLMTDYVNKPLMTYLETLTNAYVKKPIKYSACGYACSDHATWTQNGYASAIPFESAMENYNPYIHSAQDTMDKIVLNHMTDYTKLALAFVVELAGPLQ